MFFISEVTGILNLSTNKSTNSVLMTVSIYNVDIKSNLFLSDVNLSISVVNGDRSRLIEKTTGAPVLSSCGITIFSSRKSSRAALTSSIVSLISTAMVFSDFNFRSRRFNVTFLVIIGLSREYLFKSLSSFEIQFSSSKSNEVSRSSSTISLGCYAEFLYWYRGDILV
jgi:hypothetical protein